MIRPARARVALASVAMAASGVCLLAPPSVGPAAASDTMPAAVVLVDTTTTTVPDTTTTVSTTTSTLPATTTTSTPATTTTTSRPSTTTTSHPSTTTTTTPLGVPTSTTPWGLIVLVLAVVLAIVGVTLLYLSRNKRAADDTWRRRTLPALSDAGLAREALLSPSAVADDAELRAAVAVQVERASTALERAGSTAPDPGAGGSATTAAGALRGLAFAVEADRLLRNGAAAPTGTQLAQADQARRDRDGELQGALARLRAHVAPPADRG